jgi:hypothetical protein
MLVPTARSSARMNAVKVAVRYSRPWNCTK